MEDLKLFIEDKIRFLSSFNSDYQALVSKYFETPQNEEFESLNKSLKNIIALIDGFQGSEQ
ncbi:MAG: hypothetical protein LUG24_08590 [Clostridiales bacterium]|nr:hypothetical protein [Clostridiales bacterium]